MGSSMGGERNNDVRAKVKDIAERVEKQIPRG
jgi:hypothetical protein